MSESQNSEACLLKVSKMFVNFYNLLTRELETTKSFTVLAGCSIGPQKYIIFNPQGSFIDKVYCCIYFKGTELRLEKVVVI